MGLRGERGNGAKTGSQASNEMQLLDGGEFFQRRFNQLHGRFHIFVMQWSPSGKPPKYNQEAESNGGFPPRRRKDDKLCEVQLKGCKTLLEHEIKTYKPVRLLFLTGLDFLPEGDIQPFDDKRFVKASGSLALVPDTRTRVVVAVHPQGKKENKWVEKVVDQKK